MEYLVLAYYYFTELQDPAHEVARHKEFFSNRDVKGRIYISREGINGQMSASPAAAKEYMQWMKSDSRFANMEFKIHNWHEHCFPRQTVKLKSQLVALDLPVDIRKTGVHLSPKEWKQMLKEKDENTVVIDVRNDYEWDIGHFEGADLPKLDQFRQFPQYVDQLKEEKDPSQTRVMMYCTGGIRCELYSALMKEKGFTEVYQLDGGVIKYGLEEGLDQWKGKLFVFDDRLSIGICPEKEGEVISQCTQCSQLSDLYFNCANMDCNKLFLSCPSCAQKHEGCCSDACQSAPRVRAFTLQGRPKPFRRMHQTAQETCS